MWPRAPWILNSLISLRSHMPLKRNLTCSSSLYIKSKVISKRSGEEETLWDLYNEVIYPPRDPRLRNSPPKIKSSSTRETLSATDPAVNLTDKDIEAKATDKRLKLPFEESSTYGKDGHDLPARPAEITTFKQRLMCSNKKMLLMSIMIRGLSVDEAFKQLGFRTEKTARLLEEIITETVEKAVTDHDVEFCTKLWIENIYVTRGDGVDRIHRDMRGRMVSKKYHFVNVALRLREGDPPKLYHPNKVPDNWVKRWNAFPQGQRGWGSGTDAMLREIARLRRLKINYDL